MCRWGIALKNSWIVTLSTVTQCAPGHRSWIFDENRVAPDGSLVIFDASDINDAIDILAQTVRDHNLPPKCWLYTGFTQGMIKNYQDIKLTPEVQVVIDMDGFGDKILKESTWKDTFYKEPVQFTGFKLFYKNDTKLNWQMYTPEELMQFTPRPVYIQYQ